MLLYDWLILTALYAFIVILIIELVIKDKDYKQMSRYVMGITISYSAAYPILSKFINLSLPFQNTIHLYFLSVIVLLLVALFSNFKKQPTSTEK